MKTRLKALAQRLPSPLYRTLRSLYRRFERRFGNPQAAPIPGPLVTQIFPRIAQIPGWFNLDDAAHFSLILETQTAAGMRGDLLEIGCYHGRSAALLAMYLKPGERLVACDAFDLPLRHSYGDSPSPDMFLRNLQTAVPQLRRESVEIHRGYSQDLQLAEKARFRFAHVDGGHERDEVLRDLSLCASRMLPGGIIALDDYFHPDYVGVTEGAQLFLEERGDFQVLADLNRRGALGRKLYLRFAPTVRGETAS